ncbi:MAG: hypothetical protein ACE5NP_07410 [Anaerolineae bacterium]
MEIPLEKRYDILNQIVRASHFEWLAAAKALAGEGVSELDLVLEYWEIVGHDTARSYLKRLNPNQPLPRQIAENFAFSSLCMGEDVVVVEGEDDQEAFVQHNGCPWYEWHMRQGKLEQDQPGCDKWVEVFMADINKELSSDVKWQTLKSLPNGDDVCLRRFWVE